MSPRRLVLAFALGIIVTVPASRPDAQTAPAAGAALSGLPSSLLAAFEAGKAVFRTEEAPATGLGPVFNAKSCLECHSQPATGGSGMTASTFAMRFARHVEGEPFDPLLALGGPALQSRSVSEVLPGCSLAPESIPAVANHTERRQPPPLFGLGLIAAIPEATIAANADPNDVNGDGIAGRVNHINGMLGRFGWKAAGTTLTDFVALAMIGELGVTNPLFRMEMAPQGVPAPAGCDIAADPEDNGSRLFALVDFLTYLAPPP
ncbi:MAG TPA: di-heme oxidoredictase family protein, partial [Terriglobales bacterium]|nr:di-heme oxidoredictase family protein [Terriglobales bacterium]